MAAPLREIDEGWDYKVLIIEGEWVLRIPRHPPAVEALEKEIELLPALGPLLPVEVPRFEQVSREPWFVVYPVIRGEPLADEDPDGLRAFLETLHSLDVADLPAPRPDWLGTCRENGERFRRTVLPLLDGDERTPGEALLQEIETLTGYEPALVHCDLGSSHLLCRDGRLVGVIDWADAVIGDPAIDYAPWLNGPFPGWDVDDELRRRSLVYHRLGPWHEVAHGVLTNQPGFVRSGLAGVRSRL
jgi:aminoglycoside phosphotransferase (APT) family kinase protein